MKHLYNYGYCNQSRCDDGKAKNVVKRTFATGWINNREFVHFKNGKS